ncbi:hypothetical protein NPIL_332661 [Nephila pilipes]|uniref:Uncharacterized protein n=1 Tax=Nephila pilipes TaxID=299642 RepID=A0A8X6N8H8_NEPPI|nr:hypothetical protein NPIL_332661 [Nephila pilipes]
MIIGAANLMGASRTTASEVIIAYINMGKVSSVKQKNADNLRDEQLSPETHIHQIYSMEAVSYNHYLMNGHSASVYITA